MLELKHIDKYYNIGTINEMCLFDDFNLTVEDGQFVSVIGSNGSGKTSMLNIICGSSYVDSGSVIMNGEDITNKKEFLRYKDIGRVYQDPSMGTCPDMTILENMAIADNKAKSYGLSLGINRSRVEYYKEQLRSLNLGLEDKLHVKVGALSGGQRQAMSLLMSTMTPLDFLILDEPTRGIDVGAKYEIYQIMIDLVKQGKSIIMISSEMPELIGMSNRIIVMCNGHITGEVEGEEATQERIMSFATQFDLQGKSTTESK